MRYLTFDRTDESSVDNYSIIYQGLVGTARGLDRGEVRIMSHILDKFEAIGAPEKDSDGAKFALSKSGTVILEDAEYELANDCLTNVRWKPISARRAMQGMGWFENAPAHEQAENSV